MKSKIERGQRNITEPILFSYLDELRESGIINMWGAASYLIEDFDLPPNRASDVLLKWMKTYSKRHPEEVK